MATAPSLERSPIDLAPEQSVQHTGLTHPEPISTDRFADAFERVKPTRDTIIKGILSLISQGTALPGSRLPAERQLAKSMGVSRDTLREAIRALAQLGYLETRRGRYGGTFVCDDLPAVGAETAGSLGVRKADLSIPPVTPVPLLLPTVGPATAGGDTIDEIVSTIRIVQNGALERLCGPSIESEKAVEALREQQRDIARSPVSACRVEDARFHIAVVQVSGLNSLVDVAQHAWQAALGQLQAVTATTCTRSTNNDVHWRLIDAVEGRRLKDALEIERLHLATLEWVLRNEV